MSNNPDAECEEKRWWSVEISICSINAASPEDVRDYIAWLNTQHTDLELEVIGDIEEI